MQIVGVKMQILIHFPEFNATLCERHIIICILVCQALDVSRGENKLKQICLLTAECSVAGSGQCCTTTGSAILNRVFAESTIK